ncbi:hypothetical protein C0J52_10526 [Blattella germanica]|nr:hypothetical protein C0J52_10526 [Blattella germanica]
MFLQTCHPVMELDRQNEEKTDSPKEQGNARVRVDHFMDPKSATAENRGCKCSQQCWKLTPDMKAELLEKFCGLSPNEQSLYLVNCMEMREPKRRKVPETVSRRQVSFTYSVEAPDRITVCLKTLCDCTGATPRRIQMLQKKMKLGKTDFSDMRGRHNKKSNRVSAEVKSVIRAHVLCFPKFRSAHTGAEYLSADLDVLRMFELFQELHPNLNVSEYTYTQLCEKEFSLQFGLPRSSACPKCDTIFLKLCTEKSHQVFSAMAAENALHHKRAEKAYRSLNHDLEDARRNPGLHVLCADLQELPCPGVSNLQSLMYCRLEVSNYAVRDLKLDVATMHIWDETIAGRGPLELAAVLLHYITSHFKPLLPIQNRNLIQQDLKNLQEVADNIAQGLQLESLLWLRYHASDPYFLKVRSDFNSLSPWSVHSLRKPDAKQVPSDLLLPLYSSLLPIKSEKKRQLLQLCENMSAGQENRGCKCSQQCWKLTPDMKAELLGKFCGLSPNEQSLYLVSCMEMREPKRRKVPETVSRRTVSFTYSVEAPQRITVCLKTLCDCTGVTACRIQMLQKKMKLGKTDFSDMRGQHNKKSNRASAEVKSVIRAHVLSFPRRHSAHTGAEYLPVDIDIMRMFELFRKLHPNLNVSEYTYTQLCEREFNLQFGLPRSSACPKCDAIFLKLCTEKTHKAFSSIAAENALHHKRADKAYKTLNRDLEDARRNPGLHVLCADLQELQCPGVNDVQTLTYRRLEMYNYAVRDLKLDVSTMHIWDETIAGRGPLELAAVLLHYITSRFKPLLPIQNRNLIVWFDRCVEHQTSWPLVALFHYLVSHRYFTLIDLKFIGSGHSFLPFDCDFALITRLGPSVRLPTDWVPAISKAREDKPLQVEILQQQDLRNLQEVADSIAEGLQLNSVVWLRYHASDPYFLKVRPDFTSSSPWSVHSLRKPDCKPVPNDLPPIHTALFPIEAEKKQHLLQLCEILSPGQEPEKFYLALPCQ